MTERVHPLLEEAEIFEAAPNKLFSTEQTNLVRFLKFKESVPCCFCGKKKKNHWTMRCNFKVADLEPFALKYGEKTYCPGSPVCTKHLMLATK